MNLRIGRIGQIFAPSGYTYTQVSAIFQRDLPVNSLKYLREHRPGEFVICEVSRI